MEPSYRATARLDSGFYDRIASLANDAKEFTTAVAAPGRKAKIAWERALQKVPPGCLVRLEGTEGKDSDRISLLRYDGKSKEAKIAIWFEKIEAVLTNFSAAKSGGEDGDRVGGEGCHPGNGEFAVDPGVSLESRSQDKESRS